MEPKLSTLHRGYCSKCGCRTEFLKGKCLTCDTRSAEVRPEIKHRKRRGNAAGRSSVVPAIQSPQSQQVPTRLETEGADSVNAERINDPRSHRETWCGDIKSTGFVGENPASITPQTKVRRLRKGKPRKRAEGAGIKGERGCYSLSLSARIGAISKAKERSRKRKPKHVAIVAGIGPVEQGQFEQGEI